MTGQIKISGMFPTASQIRTAIQTARNCGVDVASVEMSRTGTIRVMESRAIASPESLYEVWESKL